MDTVNDEAFRSAPAPSLLTAAFWEAATEGRLVRPVCSACGQSFFTPQVACPYCLSESWRYCESSGSGEIYSFTVVHHAQTEDFETPYVLAIVDLDESWSMLTNIVGCDPHVVRIGMRVRVAFSPAANGVCLPVFIPECKEAAV
jgi:uncharacterized OB-fold protein